ncbi:MAG: hypothetical protein WCJ29_01795 [bacterium]
MTDTTKKVLFIGFGLLLGAYAGYLLNFMPIVILVFFLSKYLSSFKSNDDAYSQAQLRMRTTVAWFGIMLIVVGVAVRLPPYTAFVDWSLGLWQSMTDVLIRK